MDESDRWVTLAFTWNGLRALGVPEESLADLSRRVPRGHGGARRHPRRHRRQRPGALGRRPGRRRSARDRDPVLAHRRAVPTVHRGARQAARPHRRRAQSVVPRPERDAAVQLRPRPFRLPGPAVAAGDEGLRRGADAGLGRCAGAGRVHPRLPRRERAGRESACSPRCCRATAATWRTGGCRSTSRRSATTCARTPKRRKSRNCSRRSSWAAGAAARRWCWHRTRTIPSSARIRCATTTSTTRRWTRSDTRARWARMPAG